MAKWSRKESSKMVVPCPTLLPQGHTLVCPNSFVAQGGVWGGAGAGSLGYKSSPVGQWGTEQNVSIVLGPVRGEGWQSLRFL